MLSVIVSILLQTVVCEVHVVIFILERIVIRAGSEIAFFVEVEVLLVGCYGPDSDVELTSFE
jgi:hypothetical protein